MVSNRIKISVKIGVGLSLLQFLAAPCRAQIPGISPSDISKLQNGATQQPSEAPKLPPSLNEIATAKRLEDMNSKLETPLKQALKEIKAKLKGSGDNDLRADLDWIRANGSAAGQVLASLLIGPGLNSLKELPENTSVAYYSKGSLCHYTVSDIVADQSSKAPILKLLP